jgi:hypothetical protein
MMKPVTADELLEWARGYLYENKDSLDRPDEIYQFVIALCRDLDPEFCHPDAEFCHLGWWY